MKTVCLTGVAGGLGSCFAQVCLEQGVRFLLIHPGWMRTAMGSQRASLEPMDSAKGIYALVEKEKHKLDNDLFMDYNGTPRPW